MEARGKVPRQRSSRSYASIVRANTLNIPNGILFGFGVLTLVFGAWQDALFLGILIANVVIGSFQEIRSKRALDRLAALVAPETVTLEDAPGGGTVIRWRSEYERAGPLTTLLLRLAVRDSCKRLAKAASA